VSQFAWGKAEAGLVVFALPRCNYKCGFYYERRWPNSGASSSGALRPAEEVRDTIGVGRPLGFMWRLSRARHTGRITGRLRCCVCSYDICGLHAKFGALAAPSRGEMGCDFGLRDLKPVT